MSSCLVALIAEDDTDCDAIRKIIHRVLGQNIGTKRWASRGCSPLKRKLKAKLELLSKDGCDAFIIVHDLDRNPENRALNDERRLRSTLEALSAKIPAAKKHICIPIEELEAWFWADQKVIEYIGSGKGKAHPNPQWIEKPKEKLIKLSANEKRKPRYSTNMNSELAEILDLDICSERCSSFQGLLQFLHSL